VLDRSAAKARAASRRDAWAKGTRVCHAPPSARIGTSPRRDHGGAEDEADRSQRERELQWFEAGFSPRKQNLTLYLMSGFEGSDALLKKLGKHTKSVSCLYLKRLADADGTALRQLVERSVKEIRKRYA
jgi:hypothetical protein